MTYKPTVVAKKEDNSSAPLPSTLSRVNHQAELSRYERLVFGKLPKNSQVALISDKKRFLEFCSSENVSGIPTEPTVLGELIISYVEWLIKHGNKRKTVDRRIAGLRKYLRIMKIPFPMESDETLKDALKRTVQLANARDGQAEGLKTDSLEKLTRLVSGAKKLTYKQLRDITMLNLAFDTLLRRQNIVNIKIADLRLSEQLIYVEKSKTDQGGEGSLKHITKTTKALIDSFLERTPSNEKGYLFRPSKRNGEPFSDVGCENKHLNPGEVSRIFKSLCQSIGLDSKHISGHSTRVGATQMMFEAGIPLSKITQAGDWKSEAMPLHYGKEHAASEGAAADLARKTGR